MPTPGECFKALWKRAEVELAGEHERLRAGAVQYALRLDDRDLNGGGEYRCFYGLPSIRLFRSGRSPDPQDRPDLITQPDTDASVLAHEFGHFLSDPTDKLHDAYARACAGQSATPEEKRAILAEEEAAWRCGRAVLADLGCDEWERFETMRGKCLATYCSGLSAVGETM